MIRSVFIASFGLLAAGGLQAADWQKAEGATLGFKGTYQGEAFEGRFERFTPTVAFDPADLASARFEVEIDVASAKTGIADYDGTMQSSEFFDSATWPTAHFVTFTFRQTGEDTYEADAELTIRDKTAPLVFPFRFAVKGDRAELTSTVVLHRLDFDVGTGDWADPSLIANDIEVTVNLPLTRVP